MRGRDRSGRALRGCAVVPGAPQNSSHGRRGVPHEASLAAALARSLASARAMDRRGARRPSDDGTTPGGTRPRLHTPDRPCSGRRSTVGPLPSTTSTSLGAGSADPCPRSDAPLGSDSSGPVTGTQLAATGGILAAHALLGHTNLPQPSWTMHHPFRHRAAACIVWSFATLDEAAAFTGAVRQCGAELGRPLTPGVTAAGTVTRP